MKIFLILFFLTICTKYSFAQKTLHLYGGTNKSVYLGCLNCDKLNSNSIWNELGIYGSNLNEKSIWNDYGTFGGELSDYSPFNSLGINPPEIRDKEGNSYGYLTLNTLTIDRADFKLSSAICKYWKEIKGDVSKWYDKIFQ
jgi:hypothetical protein